MKGLKKDLGEYEVLRNIVSDADKLEAIGEVGVLRCYQYTMESQPHLSTQQVELRSLVQLLPFKLKHSLFYVPAKWFRNCICSVIFVDDIFGRLGGLICIMLTTFYNLAM